jgi:hypothetical protein
MIFYSAEKKKNDLFLLLLFKNKNVFFYCHGNIQAIPRATSMQKLIFSFFFCSQGEKKRKRYFLGNFYFLSKEQNAIVA